VLARQQDDIVLDPNCDLIERDIGEIDVLGIDDGAIIAAFIANEARAPVVHDVKSTDLKLLDPNFRVELQASDLVEQPIGSGLFGEILHAVRVAG